MSKSKVASKQSAAERLAGSIAQFASDKKAENITILDMNGVVNYCDCFVICSGNTERHVKAIVDGIEEGLAKDGIKVRRKQGLDGLSKPKQFGSVSSVEFQGLWVLVDLGDVVVHVFESDARNFYGLEHLWRDAKKIEFKE